MLFGLEGPDVRGQVDTVRALLHDLRGPVAAIRLLSNRTTSDRRMGAIAEQAVWLGALIEATLGEGDPDRLEAVDMRESVESAVGLWRSTAACDISVEAPHSAWGWARPMGIGRALGCLLDNAVRAADVDGRVLAEVVDDASSGFIRIRIIDDGPGPGRIPPRTSLGLTTTQGLVAACNGAFTLRPGDQVGTVAEIQLDRALTHKAAG